MWKLNNLLAGQVRCLNTALVRTVAMIRMFVTAYVDLPLSYGALWHLIPLKLRKSEVLQFERKITEWWV